MTNEEIKSRLIELSDEKYKTFSGSLIPDCNNIIGVRIPKLRKLAKELVVNYEEYLRNATMDSFEEIMLKGLVIGYAKCEFKNKAGYVREFVPEIDNWSVNDTFCSTLKFKDKEKQEVYELLMEYSGSDKEFEQRFVAVMLMDYFLDEVYIDRVLSVLDSLKVDAYYTKMGVAWAVATAYAKFPEKTYQYMTAGNTLDDFTYNKAIQKMIESYRVTEEDKLKLRRLKR